MKRVLLMLSLAISACFVSCVKETDGTVDNGAQEELDRIDGQLASIGQTINAIMASIADLEHADEALGQYIAQLIETSETIDKKLNDINQAIESLKAGLGDAPNASEQDVLNTLAELKTSLEAQLAVINTTLAALQAKDTELEASVASLTDFVNEQLGETKDWAEAQFATLEKYQELVEELAAVKIMVEQTRERLDAMEADMKKVIAEEIAAALEGFRSKDMADAAAAVAAECQAAIDAAAETLTAECHQVVSEAVDESFALLKAWLDEQFANYYTMAEVDALVEDSAAQMQAGLDAQKALIEALIASSEAGLQEKIDSNAEEIEALKAALEALEGQLGADMEASLRELVEAIEENAQLIAAASEGISENTSAIAENADAIETNRSLIDENAEAVNAVEAAVEELDAEVAELSRIAGANAAELAALAASVNRNAATIAEYGAALEANGKAVNENAAAIAENKAAIEALNNELETVRDELTAGYMQAIEDAVANAGKIDSSQMEALNEAIDAKVAEINALLQTLLARVESCEDAIEDIMDRLGDMQAQLETLKELLQMIQSVTFVSEYSTEAVIAYYDLVADADGDGMMEREPSGAVEMNFLIRPAAAVEALADPSLWNKDVCIKGYYAPIYKLMSADYDFVDMNIVNVTADAANGMLTVYVANSFTDDFYWKKTGAKAALAIKSGKTDITSRFVEIVPKDRTDMVYVEGVAIVPSSVRMEKGEQMQLTAAVTPSDASVTSCTWKSMDEDIVKVDQTGRLTAVNAGEAVVMVTTDGTDEFGRNISAECKVVVVEALRVIGPTYVEAGATVQLNIDYPSGMNVGSLKWSSADESMATVSQTGLVTGVSYRYNTAEKVYNTVDISCTVDDVTVTHKMMVVALQPRSVAVSTLADNQNEVVMKTGSTFELPATILPEAVDESLFRIIYRGSDNSIATVDFDGGSVDAKAPGSMWVDIEVLTSHDGNYYAPGHSVKRTVNVSVEPYWVQAISLPESMSFEVGSSTMLMPTLTSDVPGVQPSYPELEWTSSNPAVATVDRLTGEINAIAAGTAVITASTVSEWAVKDGGTMSASCRVDVTDSAVKLNVGDYYFSDGTWSSQLEPGKTVIGVVFAKLDATASDPGLAADHSECRHGLVISTAEYKSACAVGRGWSYYDLGSWCATNGYPYYFDQTHPVGYSNTKGYMAANAANVMSYGAVIDFTLFGAGSPVAVHKASVSAPAESSGWYMPSYKEMQLIYESKDVVNAAIASVSGTKVAASDYQYWCSTFDLENKVVRAVNMNNGQWMSSIATDGSMLPVRVVLAF